MQELLSILEALKTFYDIKKLTEAQLIELKDPKNRQEFINNRDVNVNILEFNGGTYVFNKDFMPQEVKQYIKEQYTLGIENPRDIEIIEDKFSQRIEKNEAIAGEDPKLSQYYQYLDNNNKNILKLAYKVKYWYEHDCEEANFIKADIGEQYKQYGNKLCNLYTEEYINKLIDYLEDKYELNLADLNKIINSEIINFVNNSDYIYFIHSNSNRIRIIHKIENAISIRVSYIAVHSACDYHVKIARYIFESIKNAAKLAHYYITEESKMTSEDIPHYSFVLYFLEPESLIDNHEEDITNL